MLTLNMALLFLSESILTLFTLVLLLRFYLQLSRASARNAVTQWILKITRPIIKPLQRILPTWGQWDSALIVLCLLAEMLKTFISGWLKLGIWLAPIAVLVFSCGELFQLTLHLYSTAIIVQAVLSWINPQANALTDVLYTLTSPLLNLARRYIPPLGGVDLSPIPVLLGLQLLNIVIAMPVMRFAVWMM